MNHTAVCIGCKFTFRENRSDEERNQKGGFEKVGQEGASKEEEVV